MLGTDVPFSKAKPFEFAARYVAHDGDVSTNAAAKWCADFEARDFPF